jgi:hypothetical protein
MGAVMMSASRPFKRPRFNVILALHYYYLRFGFAKEA